MTRDFLPPPGPSRPRAGLPRLPRVEAVGSATSLERELAQGSGPGAGDGRLVRVRRMPAAEGRAYARTWGADADRPAAPAGVEVWERRRRDATAPAVAGRPAMRRQRLALTVRGGEALTVHWSVPEPPTREEEAGWARLLARLSARD